VRILIDESLPRYLKQVLAEHAVFTVQEMGWAGIRNSELLAKAESNFFDVLLTADKNLCYQQNLSGLALAIIVFPSNRLSVIKTLAPQVKDALSVIRQGEIVEL
jgi:predicted nuclease of predicted toxin-antitoxin system